MERHNAKNWLIQLQENGRGFNFIHSIRGVLRPAFQMAVDDDLLLKNPFEFQLVTVIANDLVTKEAAHCSRKDSSCHLSKMTAISADTYEGICILFKTGFRISGFCGLTLTDIDMKERTINVNHQLQRSSRMEYLIEDIKTNAGTRMLPMTDEVYERFSAIIQNRPRLK